MCDVAASQVFAVLRDGSTVPRFVVYQGSERHCVLCDGCSGWRPPDSGGGTKLDAYHQSCQPHSSSLFPLMFWDFGSFHLVALRRPSGQLLRQRQVDVAASSVPTVAAAANSAIPTLRSHRVSAVAAQFQVNLSIAWQNSVAPPHATPREEVWTEDRVRQKAS